MTKLFDESIVGGAQGALNFISTLLLASTEFSLIGTDLTDKILLWNEGARRLYGYEADEVIGISNLSQLFASQDVETTLHQLKETALKEGRWEGSIKHVHKNGEQFTAHVILAPNNDANGHTKGFLFISNEFNLNDKLIKKQFYTRSLIELNADASMTTDPSGFITDVNQQMEKLTGCSREDLIGSPFKKFFTDTNRAEEAMNKVLKDKKIHNYELIMEKSGIETNVSYNASTFYDASEKLQGVFASLRDITEQKILEQQLRDLQIYTRSLIESNIDGLMTTDPVGLITDVNQQTCRMTGYTRKELIGTPFKKYFTNPARAEDGIRVVLKEGRVTNYELTVRSHSGKETVVSFNAAILNDQAGRLRGVLIATRDITERILFEKTLQEKNIELENANFTKDRFLERISHELRTPLNAIIGFTGILLMKLPGPLNPEQEKQLNTVKVSSHHLLSLINDLLDLAKIESGKVEIKLEKISCQKVINEIAVTLTPLAELNGLQLNVEFPKEEIIIETDRRALMQILINLVNNAIKFTINGKVKITLEMKQKEKKKYVMINVIDEGMGIKTENQTKLFQAFQQITSSGKGVEGTGLGLYLSQKLAELINSKIEFESEYGKGSRFSVELPI